MLYYVIVDEKCTNRFKKITIGVYVFLREKKFVQMNVILTDAVVDTLSFIICVLFLIFSIISLIEMKIQYSTSKCCLKFLQVQV